MKSKNTPLASLIYVSLLGFAAPSQAEVITGDIISVNLNSVATTNDPTGAAVIGQSGDIWNEILKTGAFGSSVDGTYALNKTDGITSSGVSMTFAGGRVHGDSNVANLDVFESGFFLDSGDTSATITFSGFTAGTKVDLYLYAAAGHTAGEGATFTFNSIAQTTTDTNDGITYETAYQLGVNYVKYSNLVADGSGNITGTWTKPGSYSVFNGAQIAVIDTPPPPTITSGTWTNTAGGLWGTAGNWLTDTVASGSGSTADFNTLNIPGDTTVDLDSARTIGNLIFGDTDTATAAGWTLGNNGNVDNILNLAGATPTITVNALGETKTATISAVVAGSAGLTKTGIGTLTLSSANSYTGTTSVSDGTLLVTGQSYFNVGRTTTVASGAVFELNDSNNNFTTLMPTSTVTGAGTFRLSGNSTINQDLNGTVGTRLTIDMQSGGLIDLQGTSRLTNGGWQELNWTTNLADMNIASGATLDVWDGQDVIIDALTGSGTVDKLHTGNSPRLLKVGVDDGSGTFSGTITNATGGQLALVKSGSGAQTLSGSNTYTGNTTVEDGTLSIPSSGSLRFFPTTGGVTNTLSGTASATLSYLGTVNLDLSAAETLDGNFWTLVDVGSFSGPAPTFTPAAVTSTLGAFIETPVDSGTWELSVTGAKWIFSEDDGSLIYDVTATPYEIWANSFDPDIGLPAADDDNDGVTNFEEFAFGLLPDSGASVNPIAAPLKADGTFSYTRRTGSGLNYSVWYSENLDGWTEDENPIEGTPVPSGDNETVEITLSVDPLPAKLFIQVRAD